MDEAIKALLALGWRYAYLGGHGDSEYVWDDVDGKYLAVGDIEKCSVLVPPACLFNKPFDPFIH